MVKDVTGDGVPEIFLAQRNRLVVFQQQNGDFEVGQTLEIDVGRRATLDLFDIDVDGTSDLIVSTNQRHRWLRGLANGRFDSNPVSVNRIGEFADIDADGIVDLVSRDEWIKNIDGRFLNDSISFNSNKLLRSSGS